MLDYFAIYVEAGQSLNRIALQYYGSSNIDILNMLVTDNPSVLRNGITSVPAAGTRLYIRKNFEKANRAVLRELQNIGINQHAVTDEPLSPATENTQTVEVLPETDKTVVIGNIYHRAIFINCWWVEGGEWFCGTLRVLHNNNIVDYSFSYDGFSETTDSSLEFETYFDNDNTILVIKTLSTQTVRFQYEIVTPSF